jgi:hypothetical protein
MPVPLAGNHMPKHLYLAEWRGRRGLPPVLRYPYKRSRLVALRATKITASDPPSTWWPGER